MAAAALVAAAMAAAAATAAERASCERKVRPAIFGAIQANAGRCETQQIARERQTSAKSAALDFKPPAQFGLGERPLEKNLRIAIRQAELASDSSIRTALM